MAQIVSKGISCLRLVSFDESEFSQATMSAGESLINNVSYLKDDKKGSILAECMSAFTTGKSYTINLKVIIVH